MKKYKNNFLHAILVGIISALVFIVCGLLYIKAWIVFFAWANYFLHGNGFKKAMKLFLALVLGIFIAFWISQGIIYINKLIDTKIQLYVDAVLLFVMATIIIFLECIKNWQEMIAATFLGTIVYFASEVTTDNIFHQLVFPLFIGVIVGILTTVSREVLSRILNEETAT